MLFPLHHCLPFCFNSIHSSFLFRGGALAVISFVEQEPACPRPFSCLVTFFFVVLFSVCHHPGLTGRQLVPNTSVSCSSTGSIAAFFSLSVFSSQFHLSPFPTSSFFSILQKTTKGHHLPKRLGRISPRAPRRSDATQLGRSLVQTPRATLVSSPQHSRGVNALRTLEGNNQAESVTKQIKIKIRAINPAHLSGGHLLLSFPSDTFLIPRWRGPQTPLIHSNVSTPRLLRSTLAYIPQSATEDRQRRKRHKPPDLLLPSFVGCCYYAPAGRTLWLAHRPLLVLEISFLGITSGLGLSEARFLATRKSALGIVIVSLVALVHLSFIFFYIHQHGATT